MLYFLRSNFETLISKGTEIIGKTIRKNVPIKKVSLSFLKEARLIFDTLDSSKSGYLYGD